MKKPSGLRKSIQNTLILLLLGALIGLPRPLTGQADLNTAGRLDRQGNFAGAASAYLAAVERLPWMHSLWEKAGTAFYQAREYSQADEAYQQARLDRSLSAQGYMNWGDVAQAGKDSKTAIDRWKLALQRGGDPAGLFRRIAQGYQDLVDFPAELQSWQKYLALQPEDAGAQYRLGLLLAAYSPDQALSPLLEAGRLDPSLDGAVQSMRSALNTALLSEDPAYQSLLSGRALAALGQWTLAENAFQQALKVRSSYAEAWAWLAEARQQQTKDGTAEIQRAVALNPDSAMVQGLYGVYLQRQKRPVKALGAFRIAASLEPQDPGWQIAVAQAYEQTDDLVAALEYFQRATALAPQDASTWRALAEFSLRDQVDLAGVGLPAVLQYVLLAQDDWQPLDLAGQMLLELQDFPGAAALLDKAANVAPDQAAPRLHLGLLNLQTGNRPAAYTYLLKASDLDPSGTIGWQARRLLAQYFQ